MIVAPKFDGDEGMDTAWRQHDVYGEALRIIVTTCNKHARFARRLLDDERHPEWGVVDGFDHRTLQNAHDLLAAAWRFENQQLELRFGPEGPLDSIERTWLEWLRNEIAGWIDAPRAARCVQLILTHQNQPVGYAAEAQLSLDILDRFPEVPWRAGLREVHETDLTNDLERVRVERLAGVQQAAEYAGSQSQSGE